MSSRRSRKALLISAIDSASARRTRSTSAASTGKRSLGLLTLGQSNLGKYWCFFGSAVFVTDSV